MKVYSGIDIHRTFHEIAIIPRTLMTNNDYHQIKTLKVTSCREGFNKILTELEKYGDIEVTIGIDHTGGHCSAPLLNFLYQQDYTVLGWDEYQNLLDGINKLIGEDKESLPGAIVGLPVTTTDLPQEVKILPKNPPLDL